MLGISWIASSSSLRVIITIANSWLNWFYQVTTWHSHQKDRIHQIVRRNVHVLALELAQRRMEDAAVELRQGHLGGMTWIELTSNACGVFLLSLSVLYFAIRAATDATWDFYQRSNFHPEDPIGEWLCNEWCVKSGLRNVIVMVFYGCFDLSVGKYGMILLESKMFCK